MSRPFVFRLDTLLQVRRMHERAAQRRVAEKQAELLRLAQLDESTSQAILAMQDVIRRQQGDTRFDAAAIARDRAFVGQLRRQMLQRQQLRVRAGAELAALQQELRRLRTQSRSLEKLRERRAAEHEQALARSEAATAEELAQALHQRLRRLPGATATPGA